MASELGTSREVVSRILKHFESERLLSLKRGNIHVGDISGLRKKAEQGM
ncbi:MAG: helix-turn-helix domain-containing protein [Nitrospirota bacterium]